MTPAELLRIVREFYGSDPWTTSPGYDEAPEYRRRAEATRRAAAEYPRWRALLARLRPRYGVHDLSLHILGKDDVDAAYAAKLQIPGQEEEEERIESEVGWCLRFGVHVSFLGPYYVVRHPGPVDEYVRDVAEQVQVIYPGYVPIPPDIGNMLVPDVILDTVKAGEATLYHCLLSTHWPSSPSELRAEKLASTAEAKPEARGVIIYDGDTCHMFPEPET